MWTDGCGPGPAGQDQHRGVRRASPRPSRFFAAAWPRPRGEVAPTAGPGGEAAVGSGEVRLLNVGVRPAITYARRMRWVRRQGLPPGYAWESCRVSTASASEPGRI